MWRKLSTKELILLKCGVGEDSWESLGWLQGDPTSPSKGDQSWVYIGRTDVEGETPILWRFEGETPIIWQYLMRRADSFEKTLMLERLRAGGEGDNRGWGGWMASLTQWTWVWVDSRSWWWTGRPGVLRFMGSQRVGHDWATELNWDSHFLNKVESMYFKPPVDTRF